MLTRKDVIIMKNKLKRIFNRGKDTRDLEVFANIIYKLLESIKHAEFTLRNTNCEEAQFDDLLIMINNNIHEYLRLYINHRYARPSQILSAEELLLNSESIHNGIMEFKRVAHTFIKNQTGKSNNISVYDLPQEIYESIREPYIGTMLNFTNSILRLGNKIFILLSYDVHRLETGVDIIDEYYKMIEPPKLKVSFNGGVTKDDILKSHNKSDKDSDKINKNQKGRMSL